MTPVKTVAEVLEAIQQAKAGAAAFTTNFFPVQAKLQSWIDHKELFAEMRNGLVLFFRKDRDFWHLYFSAASPAQLQKEIAYGSATAEPAVMDVIGPEAALSDLLTLLLSCGFRPYSRLVRLARPHNHSIAESQSKSPAPITMAQLADSQAILQLLESSFNPHADQLPMAYEIEEAIARKQILTIKMDGKLAALLYFETQGVTSTVRYWAVADEFRSFRLGSALMRHYFATQQAVRRFILWVTAANEDALQKYRHYGYAPDGLVDHVLANSLIPS